MTQSASNASTFQNRSRRFSFTSVHRYISMFSAPSSRVLGSNNFQRISIGAYPRFIINALCSPVMALFTLTLSVNSLSPTLRAARREESRAGARLAFPSFQRGFLFQLPPSSMRERVRAPANEEAEEASFATDL